MPAWRRRTGTVPIPTAATDRTEKKVIRSQPLTGSFQIYGQPRWDLGASLGSPGGPAGEHLAEYNPSGSPIPLSPDTPCDAVLATQVDPSSPHYDPELVNIPLHDVPVTVDGAGTTAFPALDSRRRNHLAEPGSPQ